MEVEGASSKEFINALIPRATLGPDYDQFPKFQFVDGALKSAGFSRTQTLTELDCASTLYLIP